MFTCSPRRSPDAGRAPRGSSADEREDRILLISYHFPPGSSVGGLRWQKLSHYASQRGWGVDVITLDPEDLEAPDLARMNRLPIGTRVWGVSQPTLHVERIERWAWRFYRMVRSVLRALAPGRSRDQGPGAPDDAEGSVRAETVDWRFRSPRDFYLAYSSWLDHARGGAWARAASALGLRLHGQVGYRLVVTCGPPHMEHMAGRAISRRSGIPWVMDMRDAWACTPRLLGDVASPVWLALARRYERLCVEAADLVVANTDVARERLVDAHSDAAERIVTVLNGFDEDGLVETTQDDGVFRIAYAGTIYLDRDPGPLFRAVARLASKLGLTPDRIEVAFMGDVQSYNGRPLIEIAAEEGVQDFLRLYAPRPRNETLRFLSTSSVLLSLPQDVATAVPSKIYEYMQFTAWVVVQASADSATERVLRGTPVAVVDRDDVDGLVDVLADRYRRFVSGERPRPVAEACPWLSRAAQASKLFDLLDGWRDSPLPATGRREGLPRPPIGGEERLRLRSREPAAVQEMPDLQNEVPVLVITVDTEEDAWNPGSGDGAAENIRQLPDLQALFDRYEVRPTYLTTYQVATDSWAAPYLAEVAASGRGEVGCHLHPWNTPPFGQGSSSRTTLMSDLELAQVDSKLVTLVSTLRERIGVPVVSFRAGRWALSARCVPCLERRGIAVDSSVLAYVRWTEGIDAPVFDHIPSKPYRVNGSSLALHDPDGPILEVPPSVGFTRAPWKRWSRVHRLAEMPLVRGLHLPWLLARTGVVERLALCPEVFKAEEMIALSRTMLLESRPVLNVFFHSSTLLPGSTPFVETRADREAFLGRIERYLETLMTMTELHSLTLAEVGEAHRGSADLRIGGAEPTGVGRAR